MKIETEVQKLEPDAMVSLYILDTTVIGGADIFRFTSMPRNTTPVVFDGDTYTPIDISVTGFDWDGRGSFPRPKIQVSNVSNIVSNAINTLGDMVGTKFYRIRTFARHLDDGADPDPTATFPMEAFTVNQRTKQNRIYVEWELVSVLDQMGVQLPRRQCLRDSCTHRYREYDSISGTFDYTNVTCPFVAATYFKESGLATTNPAEDVCGKKIADCRLRFGDNGILPTRSFPGISKVSI